MGDVRVWTSQEAAELIRATLLPMLEGYREQARLVGAGDEVRWERAQQIGAAYGVQDVLERLLVVFGADAPGVPAVGQAQVPQRLPDRPPNRGHHTGPISHRRAS